VTKENLDCQVEMDRMAKEDQKVMVVNPDLLVRKGDKEEMAELAHLDPQEQW
jgi:hypothetical protein